MSRIFIRGLGAVSPAGWGVPALIEALDQQKAPATTPLSQFQVRSVPPPTTRPACLNHPRLRRASPVSQFATAAAHEALGNLRAPHHRLAIVIGVHAASIRSSDRFFGEVLRDPATASPAIFPETVINAPASHLAATLGADHLSYSVLGDQTAFFQALIIGAQWLTDDRADIVLVIGSEETDWLVSSITSFFSRQLICSEGAGAIALMREPAPGAVELNSITEPISYAGQSNRIEAARQLASQFKPVNELLCDSRTGSARWDRAETLAWQNWPGPQLSPRATLGEALSAATAWQFIAAADRLRRGLSKRAIISSVGSNQQAIGATLQFQP
jgi:hypothetical protein